ncbi:lipoprotein LpqH [Mycobacterium parmense]|uniref:Lipoprotein LpqH n=1 Tax=Mycobacterium parmense TaxID=185642 RepID=A0A7I7YPI1_9MYCO|nr:lipoprotein LpqH [Mycobacterium parmense]MCV7349659.1 lipoprotein LpqH [Mycobacterium parmense]BBZ43690.1 hypothetical protein MPRM_09710 [Mycobacterium parmense]
MKHRFVLAAVGALTAAASTACPQTGNWVSSADAGTVQLTVDGQRQAVQGAVSCTDAGNSSTVINVGSQIEAEVFGTGNVTSVGLHTDAVNLQYFKGGYGPGDASATVAGKTYTITGHITGSGLNGALKPFELDVTCP